MLFKTPELATQFLGLHPELRIILHDLDEAIDGFGFETLTITHLRRTPEEQEDFYWRHYMQLGPTLTEEEARHKARRRFSWHLCNCAADIRNTSYEEAELAAIRRWLTDRCKKPMWEILSHDVGRGEHLHIGIQDFLWRRKYEKSTGKSTGNGVA